LPAGAIAGLRVQRRRQARAGAAHRTPERFHHARRHCVLYLAKPVVVPIALAVLFAFLLTPIVSFLERSFLRRTGAIVISLGLAVTALSTGGWWIYQQFNSVAREFTTSGTIQRVEQKLRFLRRSSTGPGRFERF
jgi:predicted PurR-regulated permease PerM